MPFPFEKTISITKVARNFSQVIKKLPAEGYVVVVKNYKPVATISLPQETHTDNTDAASLSVLREAVWGSHTSEISHALDRLTSLPEKVLPKLLRS